MTPEDQARQQIDEMLMASGGVIQGFKRLNLSAACGIAVREVPLQSGRCDYLLLVDRVPVGVVEAKKEGVTLSTVADQSSHYAESLPAFLAALTPGRLRFLYESTGVETSFRDEGDPHPRSRPVFAFHRPETLAAWCGEADTLRARLAQMPFAQPLTATGMRDCQVEGITKLEQSFAKANPRALIQMATGAGKTFTACAFTYRMIKHAGAKRVLFLVPMTLIFGEGDSHAEDIVHLACRRSSRLAVIEELESTMAANLQRAARLRQSILHRAFCGFLTEGTSDVRLNI